MLVDANLLLYAVDAQAPEHERAAGWLEEQLNGARDRARARDLLGRHGLRSVHRDPLAQPAGVLIAAADCAGGGTFTVLPADLNHS